MQACSLFTRGKRLLSLSGEGIRGVESQKEGVHDLITPLNRWLLSRVAAGLSLSKSTGKQMLLRARVVSFLAGLGVAGSFALFQLRQDVWESHKLLSEQVESTQQDPLQTSMSAGRDRVAFKTELGLAAHGYPLHLLQPWQVHAKLLWRMSYMPMFLRTACKLSRAVSTPFLTTVSSWALRLSIPDLSIRRAGNTACISYNLSGCIGHPIKQPSYPQHIGLDHSADL